MKNIRANKAGAVELSVNMIVITVLSLVVLGIGFYLVTNIFTTATEYKEKLDEQTKDNIIASLRQSGELISLPLTKYTLQRGAVETIGVGIYNNAGSDQTFYISVECTEAIDTDQTELCAKNNGVSCYTAETGFCTNWIILGSEKETIANKDTIIAELFLIVPEDAPSGIFGYIVKVCTGNECGATSATQYGPSKKFYITVPQ